MQMKKRLSAILLACGLSVSMLGGTAFAASATASTETALEQAATEAEAVESELAKDTGETQQETTAVAQPSEVTGDRKYEQLYTAIEQSIEQTLAQVSSLSDDQIAQLKDSGDESTTRLIASWDQVREQCGAYQGVDSYTVAEDGTNVTFTDLVNYEKAAADKSKVTVTVTVDMKSQTTTYNWNVQETIGKAIEKAGENTAVGIVNVMLILILLTLVIGLFRFIPNGSRKKKELEAAEAAAPVVPETVQEPEEEGTDDGEIAAVIAAAVAAYESENGKAPADGFVVRSIRRRGRKSSWQNA